MLQCVNPQIQPFPFKLPLPAGGRVHGPWQRKVPQAPDRGWYYCCLTLNDDGCSATWFHAFLEHFQCRRIHSSCQIGLIASMGLFSFLPKNCAWFWILLLPDGLHMLSDSLPWPVSYSCCLIQPCCCQILLFL